MLVKNHKLIEQYGQEDQTVFLVTFEPQKGIREAGDIEENEWSWGDEKEPKKYTVVHNTVEVFLNEKDAIKYQEYISYLPHEIYIVEGIGIAKDLVTACDSDFGIQLGYIQVTI